MFYHLKTRRYSYKVRIYNDIMKKCEQRLIDHIYVYIANVYTYSIYIYISRLTIVSREAKKKQPYATNE